MIFPSDRKYSETHEWFLVDSDIVTIGITQYAADELTDITFVELPEIGTVLNPGDQIAEVESVKATSEVFTLVGGRIVEVNPALVEHPEMINDDAFEEGWIARLRSEAIEPLQALMSAKEYAAYLRNT